MIGTDIITYRLINQQIAHTTCKQPQQIVSWMGAMQAQEYAMAKWAIGLRLPGTVDADIEQAFNEGKILRTHLLRPTWHFVSPADIRWMLALTGPRVHAVNQSMYRKLELDSATITLSNNTLVKALQGGKQLTREALSKALAQNKIVSDGLRLGYLMMHAELDGIICSGARQGNRFTYALLDERAPVSKKLTMEEALAELILRYFTSRGPATLHDFVYWSGLTMGDAKKGVEMVKQHLVQETTDKIAYWFSPSGVIPANHFQKTFLMPDYDEYGASYKHRTALFSDNYTTQEKQLIHLAYNRMLIIDGQVKGSWKRTIKKDRVVIEIQTINRLQENTFHAIIVAAEKFGQFVGKKVQVVY